MPIEEMDMLNRFVQWGQQRAEVRALALTSTRAAPGAPAVDRLSDYDLIVAVSDPPGIQPFFDSRAWLEDFGHVLVLYRDPILPWFEDCPRRPYDRKFAYITQYEAEGLKIDFTVMPGELLGAIAQAPLNPDLDLGYRVLLDKDGLTAGMAAPTHRAYIPTPPGREEYLERVELFFHEGTYAAKYLWRDDLIPAKEQLDQGMKARNLQVMLEWRAEIDAGWSARLKAHGRGLKKIVPPELWAELEATYTGAGIEANWAALWRTVDLFAKVARQVGAALGYAYPEDLHRRCVAYYEWVQNLPHP